MLKWLSLLYKREGLRKKIIAVLWIVLVYKFLSVIPMPGANTDLLQQVMNNNQWLRFFSALMGGWMETFSVILMGLSPYINAVIIIQLLWVVIPQIGQIQKEWEQWQKKINKWTRWLALPIAFVQSYGMILLLNQLANGVPIIDTSNTSLILLSMLIATTGTMLLMWLWEIMTEYGIGNGISIIITGWVLAGVPGVISEYMLDVKAWKYWLFISILIATLAIIYIIIKFTEWNRRIPVIYSRTGREEKSYFPIRVNQAGMIPIIFAMSIATFPGILWQILKTQNTPWLSKLWAQMEAYFSLATPSWTLILVYFLLVIGFSFFYVSITFKTDDVAENIQKRGWYIPGIRPWSDTSAYLGKVSARLNLFGWSFLALIAVLPYIVSNLMWWTTVKFIIEGAGLIIIVSVILDIMRTIDSEMKMYDYSKYK